MSFGFRSLLFLQLDSVHVILNVFVFRTFDTSVRRMDDTPKVFDEDRIDPQNCLPGAFALHDVAHRQRALVIALLEIERREHLGPHFVEDFARARPLGKQRRRSRGLGFLHIFVFNVFFASLDHAVVDYVVDGLQHFTLRGGDFRREAQPIVLFPGFMLAAMKRRNC